MAGQEQQRPQRPRGRRARRRPGRRHPRPRPPRPRDEDVDAILDEIDDVLESNAEEFVKGFVQKGGQ